MSLTVLTAITGGWESALVGGLERAGGEVVVVRRCVDLADVIATAASGLVRAAVISADLRRLDAEALQQLSAAGVAVVVLRDPTDEPAERRLRQLGVREVLAADAAAADVALAVARAVEMVERVDRGDRGDRGERVDGGEPSGTLPAGDKADETGVEPRGRLVAVWGPTGAPGRTTIAVNLAAELAGQQQATVLADADTYGGCVAQVLGLLDEAPGLASAVRAADHGTLDLAHLAAAAPMVAADFRVLTGLAGPSRWPELRAGGLTRVFELTRQLCRWTVVDCGFGLEQDEELSYDTATPRRNAATLVSLELADTAVVVGSADPVGLQRLVRGLAELGEVRPDLLRVVVVNRVRTTAVGRGAPDRIREALERYAGVTDPVLVPDDRAALDAALLAGRTLRESAPSSPARTAIAALADRLVEDAGGLSGRRATMARCRNA